MQWDDPIRLAIAVVCIALESAALLGFIALVQPPLRDSDETHLPPKPLNEAVPTIRRTNKNRRTCRIRFIERYGLPLAAILCFGVLLILNVIALIPYGWIPAMVGWWMAALMLFGLTVRQAFKAYIVLIMASIGFLLAIGTGMAELGL
jgi:hypothetical protein